MPSAAARLSSYDPAPKPDAVAVHLADAKAVVAARPLPPSQTAEGDKTSPLVWLPPTTGSAEESRRLSEAAVDRRSSRVEGGACRSDGDATTADPRLSVLR